MSANKKIIDVNELRRIIVQFVEAVRTDSPSDLITFAVTYFSALHKTKAGSNTQHCSANDVMNACDTGNNEAYEISTSDESAKLLSSEEFRHDNKIVQNETHTQNIKTSLVNVNTDKTTDLFINKKDEELQKHPKTAEYETVQSKIEVTNIEMGFGEMLHKGLLKLVALQDVETTTDDNSGSDSTPTLEVVNDLNKFEDLEQNNNSKWTHSTAVSCEQRRRRRSEDMLSTLPAITDNLSQYILMVLADSMKSHIIPNGDFIFSPGDEADAASRSSAPKHPHILCDTRHSACTTVYKEQMKSSFSFGALFAERALFMASRNNTGNVSVRLSATYE